ncbi:hypothetical protein BASA62_001137 [Batrachochytrium salamandrivorans]|nr:hypothetical protein BASA62_001137 [Batrachochytrium salamandrivorans]
MGTSPLPTGYDGNDSGLGGNINYPGPFGPGGSDPFGPEVNSIHLDPQEAQVPLRPGGQDPVWSRRSRSLWSRSPGTLDDMARLPVPWVAPGLSRTLCVWVTGASLNS